MILIVSIVTLAILICYIVYNYIITHKFYKGLEKVLNSMLEMSKLESDFMEQIRDHLIELEQQLENKS